MRLRRTSGQLRTSRLFRSWFFRIGLLLPPALPRGRFGENRTAIVRAKSLKRCGDPGCYAIAGWRKRLGCPTAPKAPSGRKEQFPALSNRRTQRHTGPPDRENRNPHAVAAAQGQADRKVQAATSYTAEEFTTRLKRARHIEVAHHYAWRARQARKRGQRAPADRVRLISLIRVRELERLSVSRWGRFLPDDDAGRDDFLIVAHHIAHLGGEVEAHITAWASRWCPWMTAEEAAAAAAQATAKPIKWRADTLGWRLGLTDAERSALKITTIGAIGVGKTERLARRKEKNKLAQRARRAARSTGKPRGRPKLNACTAGSPISVGVHAIKSPDQHVLPPPQSGLQGSKAVAGAPTSRPGLSLDDARAAYGASYADGYLAAWAQAGHRRDWPNSVRAGSERASRAPTRRVSPWPS